MNSQLRKAVHTVVCALFLSLGPWAARSAGATIDCTQSAIQSVAPPNTTIVSATAQSDPVPYCDVLGYVTTMHPGPNQVNFELGLPGEWNGRFLLVGNGGFGGSFDFPSVYLDNLTFFPLLTEVSAGFATAITDTGHQGDFVDGNWALNDPSKQDDWLFRGVHVTAVTGRSITERFYGGEVHSYFAGCSDGGREGLVEAQKYPGDFDGITAGDPDVGDAGIGFNWNEEQVTSQPENYVPPAKIALLGKAVVTSCDATDGVVDHLIQDSSQVHLRPGEPAVLQERRFRLPDGRGGGDNQSHLLRCIHGGWPAGLPRFHEKRSRQRRLGLVDDGPRPAERGGNRGTLGGSRVSALAVHLSGPVSKVLRVQ